MVKKKVSWLNLDNNARRKWEILRILIFRRRNLGQRMRDSRHILGTVWVSKKGLRPLRSNLLEILLIGKWNWRILSKLSEQLN